MLLSNCVQLPNSAASVASLTSSKVYDYVEGFYDRTTTEYTQNQNQTNCGLYYQVDIFLFALIVDWIEKDPRVALFVLGVNNKVFK